jgi:arsenite-transporting ATPase
MFAGKGGVGKTTCACATALHYAATQQTMVISTDPTPSLYHIFEANCKQKPFQVAEKLFMNEIGVEEVKSMWNSKFGREVYGVFSSFVAVEYDEFVDFVSSILPGLKDEFMVDYIRELSQHDPYQKLIWDTAPLGQTLGLLKMPEMLAKHLKLAPRIYSKLKTGSDARKPVLDVLKSWERLSALDMDFLRNEVRFVIVTIPEALAIEQLDETFNEFARYGFTIDRLIINNVIEDVSSEFLHAKSQQQRSYIDRLHGRYPDLKMVELPMFPHEIKGVNKLMEIESRLFLELN